MLGFALAAPLAISSNLVANDLPAPLERFADDAWPVFLVCSALALLVGVALYLRDRSEDTKAEDPDLRDRLRLVERVRRHVEDQLVPRIHTIRLEFEARPDLVAAPREFAPQRLTAMGTTPTVANLFDWADESLLIVGGPGAGKSTLLAELAGYLVDEMKSGRSQSIPVLVSLSSWTRRAASIDDWLVKELDDRYEIPEKLASAWVGDRMLLPLFDGLDEVQEEQRAACVTAINQFRSDHKGLPIVVSCRLADYEALNTPLNVRGAAFVKPLSQQQVNKYFTEAGISLQDVRAAFGAENAALLDELLQSPLILSMIVLTYQENPQALPTGPLTVVEARERLFSVYIDAMLERKREFSNRARNPVQVVYGRQETIRWLSWLAQRLRENFQTQFRLDRLQLAWLPPSRRRAARVVAWLVEFAIYLLAGIAASMLVRLPLAKVVSQYLWWIGGWLVGSLVMLLFLLRKDIRYIFSRSMPGTMTGRLREVVRDLLEAFEPDEVESEWVVPVEVISLSWPKLGRALAVGLASHGRYRIRALFPGGLVWLLAIATGVTLWSVWVDGSELSLGLFLSSCLYIALLGGWLIAVEILVGALVDAYQKGMSIQLRATSMTPNEGIKKSAKNAALVALCAGLLAGAIAALVLLSVVNLGHVSVNPAVNLAVFVILVIAVVSAQFAGGRACIRHYALRLLLLADRSVPIRYVDFLNYASDRILVRRVGGAYEFIHPLLLHHFADLGAPRPAPRPREPQGWPASFDD